VSVVDTVLNRVGLSRVTEVAAKHNELAARLGQVLNNSEVMSESMADLELALEDRGWERLTGTGNEQFSRNGLGRASALARIMAVANPLIKQGLNVRQAYIFGGGVQVSATANGETDGQQDVNALIQEFWNDPSNRASLSGDQAQEELERAHGTDGNTFLACFTTPRTGRVQIRSIPFAEIAEIISNPDDRDEPWFYKRQWTQRSLTADGLKTQTTINVAYYPDLRYQPRTRQATIDGHTVMWTAPIYHTSVNRLDGWQFGIGDAFAALAWARAYKEFLEDWATLIKSLSRFAWKATSNKKSKAQAQRDKIRSYNPVDPNTGRSIDSGGTVVMTDDQNFEAIPKSGATIDSESGRPLASMIAAALGIPVTVLLGDPGISGNRATAETLDKPMALGMKQRRSLWSEAYRAICQYVIEQAVVAPQGKLQGSTILDPFTRRNMVVLAGDTDLTINVDWPDLEDENVKERVDAIVAADGTRKVPPTTIARLLLQALGVQNVDDVMDELTDDQGNWLDPFMNAGQAAIDAFRTGQDPASVL